MELFTVVCSTCQARIKVRKAEAIGEILACPRCQSMVQILPPAGWQAPRMAEKAFVDKPAADSEAKEASAAPADEIAANAAPPPFKRRQFALATLPLLLVGMLIAVWFARSGPNESQPTADKGPPTAVPPAANESPVADGRPAPEDAPSAIVNGEEKPAPGLPLRWLPPDARVVISIDPRSLAARPELLAELTQAKALWRDALLPLETAFRLAPERIARVTWAADDLDDWQTGGVVIVELAEPLTDDAELLADSEKLELRLDEAICHRRPQAAWKLPFAVVDERTLVSGSLDSLSAIAKQQESSQRPAFAAALRELNVKRPFAAAADLEALRKQEYGLVPLLDEWAAGEPNWPAVRDVPAAASVSLSLEGELQVDIVLACANEQDADQVKQSLVELLAAAALGVSAREAALVKQVADNGPTPEIGRKSALLNEAAAALKSRELVDDGERVLLRSHWLGRPDRVLASALTMLPAPKPAAADIAARPPATPEIVPPPDDAPTSPPPAASTVQPEVGAVGREIDIAARLKDPLKAIDLQKLPLQQLVTLLSQLSTIPIELDAGSLGEAGIATDVPVTVVLTDTNVAKVLEAALAPLMLKHEIEAGKLVIRKR